MLRSREEIDDMYETKNVERLHGISRVHFLFLFRISEGCCFAAIAEELEKTERTLYFWRQLITKKFRVNSFFQVMCEFGRELI